jgi:hypothetical protein
VPDIDWRTLDEAILEIDPDKLAICIGAGEQAIAQRESLVDTSQVGGRPECGGSTLIGGTS